MNSEKDPNDTITVFDNYPHVEFAVIDFMYNSGSRNGSFMNALIKSFVQADRNNFDRLRKGFPVIAEAIDCYQSGLNRSKFPGIIEMIAKGQ